MTDEPVDYAKLREEAIAMEAWIDACPDNPYDQCPCGCGKKFRFVVRDDQTLREHFETFRRNENQKRMSA